MECHSNLNVAQNGLALKIMCYLKLNVTQKEMSNWNVTQIGMSLKLECH